MHYRDPEQLGLTSTVISLVPFAVSPKEAAFRREQFRGLPDEQTALIGLQHASASGLDFEPVWAIRTVTPRREKCFFCPRKIRPYAPHTLFAHPPRESNGRIYTRHHLQPNCFNSNVLHRLESVTTLPHELAQNMINEMIADPSLATQERMAGLLGAVALELGVE
jgi:hypothetical protein